MTVEIVPVGEEEEEEIELTPEELRARIKAMSMSTPDLTFSMLESLMNHLGISDEDQDKILREGVKNWQKR